MKHKSILPMLLALCLLLTACGGKQTDATPTQPSNAAAYTSAPVPLNLSVMEVTAFGAGNGNLYLAGRVEDEPEPVETEDGGDGEVTTSGFTFSSTASDDGDFTFYSGGAGHAALYRMDMASGALTQLEGYGTGEGADVAAIVPCEDGSLWVLEQIGDDLGMVFDSIEGLISAAGFEDTPSSRVWRKIDAAGVEELARVDVTDLAQKLGVENFSATQMDREGRLYAASGTALTVLDAALSPLFTCKAPEPIERLISLGDGGVGLVTAGEAGRTVYPVDFDGQTLEGACTLPGNVYKICAGNDRYDFLYHNGDSLYGWPHGASSAEKILSWSGAGIDMGLISALALLPDGRGAVVTRDQAIWPVSYSAALLAPASEEDLAGRTVLTLATLGLDSDTRAQILEFNRTSGTCRIAVRDYSEYNSPGDNAAGLSKLNTEILAGNLPDLLDVSDAIPLRQYAAKGLLEDLWPFIDADMGRDALMERVFQAAAIDGKLFRVFPRFYIETAAGNSSDLGNMDGWTLDDLRAAMDKQDAGCSVLGPNETKNSILEDMFADNLDHFVDWDAGTASFDSPEFKAVLEFCNTFPAQARSQVDESPYTWIARGEQMLLPVSLGDLASLQIYRALFGGEAAFVGYPGGNGGASFSVEGGMAMTASCRDKDGAWSFLRQTLLAESGRFAYGFPVNRANFEQSARESMEITYLKDENGDPIAGPDGEPMTEGTSIVVLDTQPVILKPPTQEDYDLVMSLYERADAIAGRDENIWTIVQDGVGGYFAGDRTVEDAVKSIQSRAELYLNEQK